MSIAANYFSNDLRYRTADHPAQTQLTPSYVLEPVREALGGMIDLDPCSTEDNPTNASHYICPPADGLAAWWTDWETYSIYVNPPYGKTREPWVEKCLKAGKAQRKVVLLMPAATETRIFQRALRSAGSAVFIQGRVKFGILRPNRRQVAASHPSALIGWNVDLAPCAHLGLRVVA